MSHGRANIKVIAGCQAMDCQNRDRQLVRESRARVPLSAPHFESAVWLRQLLVHSLLDMGSEHVPLRARHSHSPGRGYETHKLCELARADARTQQRYVLTRGQFPPCALDVLGIVQKALAVQLDVAHHELAVAGHTRPVGNQGMHSPRSSPHGSVIKGVDIDAPVDYWDQIRVDKRIEDGSRPPIRLRAPGGI